MDFIVCHIKVREISCRLLPYLEIWTWANVAEGPQRGEPNY